ncbi:hypothetical protein Q5762_10880 [Streptomyces sp. P9(2023)]|uniref:hypothetical protein n=1 Tax=Streptomyces sp. P9(2023) TaxID=3064394 RepID=UPI0028F424D7|nr:hypothetical protein [Streptomyces sp. P9(2023)]MDT9688855.1 hypothetical protein [Streptomyces sp. P9(2023)]
MDVNTAKVRLGVRCTTAGASSPLCGTWPDRIHGSYSRTDAPFWDWLVFEQIDDVDVEVATAAFGTVAVVARGREAGKPGSRGGVSGLRAFLGLSPRPLPAQAEGPSAQRATRHQATPRGHTRGRGEQGLAVIEYGRSVPMTWHAQSRWASCSVGSDALQENSVHGSMMISCIE